MNVASTGSAPDRAHAGVVFLRHVYTLDADLNVLLHGTSPEHLEESAGEKLPDDVAAEVRQLVKTHDFKRRTVATGLVGAELGLRVMRTRGPAGSFYTVHTERIRLARRIAKLGRRFALGALERELLRLVAGGYLFSEMANRLELSATALRANLRELEEKVGCIGRRELALLALGEREPAVSSPSPASFPGAGSNMYPGRRAGNRHR
jgi:DNA-binding CsgD family transcriptional regulator